MKNILSSLIVNQAMVHKNRQGQFRIHVQFKYDMNTNRNHNRAGHWVSNNQMHMQSLSVAQFNRILQANGKASLQIPQLEKLQRLHQPLASKLTQLTLLAQVDLTTELINPQSIAKLNAKVNRSQDSGPQTEIDFKLQRANLNHIKNEHRQLDTVTSMANQTEKSLAMNSTTSVANSIAHSPRQLNARQFQQRIKYQEALNKFGTADEKAVALKLNNSKQTMKIQQQLANLGQKVYDRQKTLQQQQQSHLLHPDLDNSNELH